MSYLDYAAHNWNDTSPRTRLKDRIKDTRGSIAREMFHASVWRGRPQGDFQRKAVANHVARARNFNHELLGLLRKLKEMERES